MPVSQKPHKQFKDMGYQCTLKSPLLGLELRILSTIKLSIAVSQRRAL
jgi:hypothetical protein